MERQTPKRSPKPKSGHHIIKHELFWSVGIALLGAFFTFGFYAGNTKFDRNLMDLSDTNRELKNEISSLQDTICKSSA